MIYFIIMAIAVFCMMIVKKLKNKEEKEEKDKILINIFIIFSFLTVLIPQGIRYGIGTDYFYTYRPYFFFIGNGIRYFDEIGFNLLNKIIFNITNGNFDVFIFITSFLFLFFIYQGILNNSKNITLSVLLIFLGQSYFYSMNMIRQSIAIAIIFYAFKYLKEDKKIKYILFCIIASTMHISAIVMILLVFVYKININRKFKISIILISIVIGAFLNEIIIDILEKTKYSWYFTSQFAENRISYLLLLSNLIIIFIDFIYSKDNYNKDNEYKILSNINFYSILLLIIFSSIPLIYRFIRYFTIFQILFIPKIIDCEKKIKLKKNLKALIIIMMFVIMYRQIFVGGGEEVLPYISIFNVK